MNNKVIYTCLVGNYDRLLQPDIIEESFDYICFSSDILEFQVGVWKIRKMPFFHKDKTRQSRYVKLNPHKVLSEYEYSVWIDANIKIISDTIYTRTAELISKKSQIAQIQHPCFDCIYDDIYRCIYDAREDIFLLRFQYKFLKQENYPVNNGLYENNLIFRKHNDKLVIDVSELWWDVYMQFTKRDQLSLCYVYWKLKVVPDLFLPEKINTRNSLGFQYCKHSQESIEKRMFRKIKCVRNRLLFMFIKKMFFI